MLGSKDGKNPGAHWPAILAETDRLKDNVKMKLRKASLYKPLVSTHAHMGTYATDTICTKKEGEIRDMHSSGGGGVDKRKRERPLSGRTSKQHGYILPGHMLD